MDERLYMNIALWLASRTERVLVSRFGESRRDVAPIPRNEPTDPFPSTEPANANLQGERA